jgi:hypothetical protein
MPFTQVDNVADRIFFSWVTPDVGGPDVQLANNGSRLTAAAMLNYDHLNTFIRQMIGFPEIETVFPNGQPARYIKRNIPYVWPDLLDNNGEPFLFCQSVQRVEGVGPIGKYPLTGTPRYEFAKVWLTFASVPYGILHDEAPRLYRDFNAGDPGGTPYWDTATSENLAPDESTLARYVATGGDPFDRAISIPTGLMRVVYEPGDLIPRTGTPPFREQNIGGEPGPFVTESMGIVEPGWDRVYTHHHVPEVPNRTITVAMGKVNEFEFNGFPPGTLLCIAPKVRPFNSALGTIIFDIDYRFRYVAKTLEAGGPRVVGHNWFLRRAVRGTPTEPDADVDYRRITLNGLPGGRPVYRSFDFRKLFRPDPPPGTPI